MVHRLLGHCEDLLQELILVWLLRLRGLLRRLLVLWNWRWSTVRWLYRARRHSRQLLTGNGGRRKARILGMLLWWWREWVLRQRLRRWDHRWRLHWCGRLSLLRLLKDLLENLLVNQTHQEQGLKDGI